MSAVTDSELLSECRHLQTKMEAPPYNAQFVSPGIFGGAAVFKVTFAKPLAPEITTMEYNLVSIPRMNSANAVVRRDHFHDSAGSGGRLLLQTPGLQLVENRFERFAWGAGCLGGGANLHTRAVRWACTMYRSEIRRLWTVECRCARGLAMSHAKTRPSCRKGTRHIRLRAVPRPVLIIAYSI